MGARLKVLVSAYACEPGMGSEPSVGWNLACSLARHHEIWVITRSNNEAAIEAESARRPLPRSLRFVYYDLPRWARAWKRGGRGLQAYYYLWQLGLLAVARRLHREVGFDLAHHLTFGKYWAPSRLVELPIPVVWGPLGGGESAPPAFWRDFSSAGKLYEVLRDAARRFGEADPLVRRTATRASVVLASTPDTALRLERIGARDPKVLLQMGVSGTPITELVEARAARRSLMRFVTVGRLIHWKGVHLGLRAFAHASLDAEYVIVGDGPERPSLERLAVALGVSDRVRFLGALPRDETLERLADSDVLVHPSLHDQAPAVILEALAAGLPVICLELGGPALQVTDEVGIKVPAREPEQVVSGLAAAMAALAHDEGRRRKMGSRARPYVEEVFAWDVKADALSAHYASAVASRGWAS